MGSESEAPSTVKRRKPMFTSVPPAAAGRTTFSPGTLFDEESLIVRGHQTSFNFGLDERGPWVYCRCPECVRDGGAARQDGYLW